LSIKVNRKLAPLFAVCLTVLLMSGCSLLPKEEEALAPPLVKPIKQNFTAVEVKVGSIEQAIRGVSFLEAYEVIYHQFKDNGGRIQEVFVKSGDAVKVGDPLIQLEVEGLDMDIKYKLLEVEKAKAGLEKARADRDESLMKIKMLELDIAQSNYNNTAAKLNSRTLKAEMDGVVTFVVSKKSPDYVDAFENLVIVADTSKLRLMMEKSDVNSLNGAEVGMNADATKDGKTYKAKVVQTPSSAPTTDDTSLRDRYSKAIYLELEELPEGAKMGNLLDVKIITKKKDDTLIIPTQALRTFMSRNYVQILDGERISEADVEIGIKTSTEVEILAGVEEGQQLILR
jgi:multidrug efflux pump subunit AcrA (membrane-fusion protein)